MANTVKLTKKDFYAALKEMVIMSEVEMVGEIPADEVIAFIDKSVEQIDNKATKAKEKAAEKKAAEDDIYKAVVAALTADFQTIDEITAAVQEATGDEEITKSKVTARLTKAVKAEVAKKEQVKKDSRKVMSYALKEAPAADDFYLDEEDTEYAE